MDVQDRVSILASEAERIVQGRFGGVLLRDPALIAQRDRSLVVRCAATGWDGVPSVVLKRMGDDARGFTDWAASPIPRPAWRRLKDVAPRLYAGDRRDASW